VLHIAPFPRPVRKVGAARAGFRAIHASERVRRGLNIVVALVGIVAALPLMALIALIVKLTSRGPVLYTQTRVGIDRRAEGVPSGNHRRHIDYGGRLFRIYKFRTMRNGPALERQLWASPADPRITTVGKVLRKYRLDEIPQLFNVLLGDMNIVGPRPEQPDILVRLRDQVDQYQRRQRVLPGITGWAQVNQHYDTSVDDVRRKVRYDLEYINRCSAIEDARIMLRTLPVMLFRRGAW
jgi:lipopolysaccharide/colanic/teichoic acid biosynthesis glycosyltransferase